MQTDSIVAIATAAGRGAIGIVRVSAPQLGALVQALTDQKPNTRQAYLQDICDAAGEVIDRCILLYFAAPHSYTGEDVLELQAHGGPVVLQVLLDRLLQIAKNIGLPMRLAKPGEFTDRAFLN